MLLNYFVVWIVMPVIDISSLTLRYMQINQNRC